jgi:diacylglycerol kinase family enzyme
VIVRALASAVDLEVVHTRYRGDAAGLAATAVSDKFGLVMTLGGDGTVNEAVNGLLGGTSTDGSLRADSILPAALPPAAEDLPALAALPGGNANVFTRSLGLPADPVEAASRLIDDLAQGRERYIGLSTANGRYFTFNSGLGLDGEVVRAVDGRRAHGRTLTPTLFARTALRQYFRVTDRRHPAITVAEPAGLCPAPIYLCLISNSSPWTYLGQRPVNGSPAASFDAGLDMLGFRSLTTLSTLRALAQMLRPRTEPLRGRGLVTAHDVACIGLVADHPMALQVDGEYTGEVERVVFRAMPRALRVIA